MKLELGFIFTNMLALSALVAGWLNPFYGLMVYHAFSILRPIYLWFWIPLTSWPTLRYSFYVALATLAGWLFAGMGSWDGLRFVWLPMVGLAMYLLGGLISWQFQSQGSYGYQVAWEAYYPLLTVGLMMLVTFSLVRTEKQLRTLVWIVALALGYLGYNFNTQYLQANMYLYNNGFGGIDNNGTAMIMVMGVPLIFFLAINPVALPPNARIALAMLLLVLATPLLGGGDNKTRVLGVCVIIAAVTILGSEVWGMRALCALLALLMCHVVLFSYSRGAQVGLIFVGFLIFVFAMTSLPRKGMTLLGAVAAVAITLYLAGPLVRERFMTIMPFLGAPGAREASAESRFMTWRGGWECIKAHPWGVGPRNFNLISQQFGLPPNKSIHNLFLQTGADYGLLGMVGLATFYIGTFFSTFQMTRTRTAKRLVWPRIYGYMISISLAGFLACSIFIGMESVEVSYLIALIGMCTVVFVRRVAASEHEPSKGPLPELAQVPSDEQTGIEAAPI